MPLVLPLCAHVHATALVVKRVCARVCTLRSSTSFANLQRCDPTGCSGCQHLLGSMEPVELQQLTLLMLKLTAAMCSPRLCFPFLILKT